jgi:glutamate/tyrosine decarboxylase-like PLP-dependent enzyme
LVSSALPERGAPWSVIEPRMRDLGKNDVKWRDGRTGMYVLNAGPEVEQVQKAAYAMFSSENGLGPAAFPSLAQMEREVVAAGLGPYPRLVV